MEQRTLEVNVVSAKDLKNVNLFSKMDVYAVVSISGDPRHLEQKTKTPVDREDGSNPTWNFPIKFTVDEALAQQNRLNLVFNLCCDRPLGDKQVGQVIVPIKELLDCLGDGKSMQFVSYQVRRPSGRAQGELSFSYRFGDKFVPEAQQVGDKPGQTVMAYPPSMVGSSSAAYGGPGPYYNQPAAPPEPVAGFAYPPSYASGYVPPPPPPGYAYPPPPPPGYGYPAGQQGGYGYYPPVQQRTEKNKLGMGLGAGLLGGLLGGLLIGDLVSDIGFADGGF